MPVQVTYDFNPVFALLEPGLIIGTLMACFLAAILLSRIDLTIAKDARWRQAQVCCC